VAEIVGPGVIIQAGKEAVVTRSWSRISILAPPGFQVEIARSFSCSKGPIEIKK